MLCFSLVCFSGIHFPYEVLSASRVHFQRRPEREIGNQPRALAVGPFLGEIKFGLTTFERSRVYNRAYPCSLGSSRGRVLARRIDKAMRAQQQGRDSAKVSTRSKYSRCALSHHISLALLDLQHSRPTTHTCHRGNISCQHRVVESPSRCAAPTSSPSTTALPRLSGFRLAHPRLTRIC